MATFAVAYMRRIMGHRIISTLCDAINPFYWITAARNRAFDRGWLKSHRFSVPTICIGNITVGGTGKTPHTEYLVNLLKESHSVAVLSRGYGRRSKGFIKASTDSTMQMIGDEPFQIKNKFPDITVAVDEKRADGIERLIGDKEPPSVILLDDAYQHRHVSAGLNILLIDSNRPLWNDSLMPFGRLRESAKGTERADIIIVTKCSADMPRNKQEEFKKRIGAKAGTPIFFSTVKYGAPYPIFPDRCQPLPQIDKEHNILLITGIAKPQPLKERLVREAADVTLMQFSDHHNFTQGELENVARRFKQMESLKRIIITTEKDATRLVSRNDLPEEIAANIYALPIEIEFLNDEKNMFNQIIFDYVTENSRDSRISQG